ncbi:hypothetical protein [Streptomyces luteireticuli]|uniref:hypothetical protein n=1 Tax=Streptomyces luteireticuli TaxID=173858 RepID=UPI003557E6AB
MSTRPPTPSSSPVTQETVDALHAEIDHLTTVHRAAARLAVEITEHLAGQPFAQALKLVRLLEGALEPDDVTADDEGE